MRFKAGLRVAKSDPPRACYIKLNSASLIHFKVQMLSMIDKVLGDVTRICPAMHRASPRQYNAIAAGGEIPIE